MPQQHLNILTFKDEITNVFRPIEQLFRIMDKSTTETSGDLIRSYGEVGLELCENFRRKLNIILTLQNQEADDDCR